MATTAVPAIPTVNAYINPAGFSTPGLENHGYTVWLALVIMVIISGTTVCLRVLIRTSANQMGSDDWAIVAAMTTLWAMSVRTGYGSDYLKLSIPQRQEFNKYWFLGAIFYPVTLGLFKTSVILLNKRIFVQQKFQIVCWITLVVNSCWCLGNTLGWIFQCLPVQSMWGMAKARYCFDNDGKWISLVTWDVGTDVWIMAMAVPMIWHLRLATRQKIGLIGIFMLGAVVVVFSIMSCSAVLTSVQYENVHGHKQNKYGFALANLFQVLESNMGVIGASLPVLRIPAKQFLPRIFGGRGSSQGSGKHAHYYESDSFTNRYVLQKLPERSKDGSWHNVSVSGGDKLRSGARKSDELGIIEESADIAGKSADTVDWSNGGSMSPFPSVIRKQSSVHVSVNRT
ncbi:hypothetical protein LTR78_002754 [Recurvomyces mirabilis]|uniref:Rhodopsin domain-containing protein n=1 Tax=Recurvomyces mirabilis TaxID=574656 RepID=A0AAE0WSQ9_9PEZI|nr:hypothetical protein LTR78_002754 [Recurvomyces mirabilis]